MSAATLNLCRHWVVADNCFKCKEEAVLRGIGAKLRALFRSRWCAKRGPDYCIGAPGDWSAATLLKAAKVLECKPAELFVTVDFEGVDEETVLSLDVRKLSDTGNEEKP